MKQVLFLFVIVVITSSGCHTGKGLLRDTQNVLGSVAGIINSSRTIADVAK